MSFSKEVVGGVLLDSADDLDLHIEHARVKDSEDGFGTSIQFTMSGTIAGDDVISVLLMLTKYLRWKTGEHSEN